MTAEPFDPRALLAALERHRVNYVVIGGLARVIQGTDEITHDVDVCPSLRPDNLRRLGTALAEIGARTADGEAFAVPDEASRLSSMTELETSFGHLTLVAAPPGTRGYDDLRRGATREALGHGLRASIAGPGDLLRTLDGLDRPDDAARIETLRHVAELERSLGLEL